MVCKPNKIYLKRFVSSIIGHLHGVKNEPAVETKSNTVARNAKKVMLANSCNQALKTYYLRTVSNTDKLL